MEADGFYPLIILEHTAFMIEIAAGFLQALPSKSLRLHDPRRVSARDQGVVHNSGVGGVQAASMWY
jgi:hypothetical protein